MSRQELSLRLKVGERYVTIKAMDAVGVEDVYGNQLRSVLHRYLTGEDLTMPAPREVKDFIVRSNLNV